MKKRNRRRFLGAAAAVAAGSAVPAQAQGASKRKVHWRDGKKPDNPLFSPAVSYGDLLFIAGKGAHFEGDISAHTKHVLDTIQSELTRCGSSMDKVVKCQCFLTDGKDFATFNEIYIKYFPKDPPARSTVVVKAIVAPGALLEIDCFAYVD